MSENQSVSRSVWALVQIHVEDAADEEYAETTAIGLLKELFADGNQMYVSPKGDFTVHERYGLTVVFRKPEVVKMPGKEDARVD